MIYESFIVRDISKKLGYPFSEFSFIAFMTKGWKKIINQSYRAYHSFKEIFVKYIAENNFARNVSFDVRNLI